MREEFRENPNAFMRAEERFDSQEAARPDIDRRDRDRAGDRRDTRDTNVADNDDRYARRGDNDMTQRELASMDHFMDGHPEIAEQLRKDPSLIDNQQFIANHPALQEYLQSHPGVRAEFRENPNASMHAEERYDRREKARAYNYRDHDRDFDRRATSNFGEFLRGHTTTADALASDPTLANNREFLETHPDLREYLKAHPGMQQQLATNPQAVMTSPALAGTVAPPHSVGKTAPPKPEPPTIKPEPQR